MDLDQEIKTLPPTVLTIFGVTGNLSTQKLLPALYHLLRLGHVPAAFKIMGVFRSDAKNLDDLMREAEAALQREKHEADPATLQKLREIIQPIMMDSTNGADFERLKQELDSIDQQSGVQHNRLFYLAIPPDIFKSVLECLSATGLNKPRQNATSRILIEKPFGTNLQTARELVEHMTSIFEESQIYRIDHYLAKETAQNILTFRFNNPLVEDIWGRQFIDHIQITASEMIGIEGRSNFYEGMGALRDFVQSHLMQLMVLITMEAPASMKSEDIHAEKLALLQAVTPIKQNHVGEVSVRGQYQGYPQEAGNPDSNVETFAAIKLDIANSRWGGVPILLRTGKALDKKSTAIHIVFKDNSDRTVPENIITIRIQPDEGISLQLTAKKPGFEEKLQPVNMDFSYEASFGNDKPDAYERVLVDAMSGDQSLFSSSEEVIRSWEILEAVLEEWQYLADKPQEYMIGSQGPTGADDLAKSFGVTWF